MGYTNSSRKNKFNKYTTSFASAPYNFIPFPETYYERYRKIDDIDNIPSHSSLSDGKKFFSGYLNYTVKIHSPLFISDGEEKSDFYNILGEYCIPGSTIRGKVYSNCEVLSNAYPRFIKDSKFSFREFASGRSSLKKAYKEYISVERGNLSKKINNIVKVGIIKKENGRFIIKPLKRIKDNNFELVKNNEIKKLVDRKRYENPSNYDLKSKNYKPYLKEISYNDAKGLISNILGIEDDNNNGFYLMNSNKMNKKFRHYLISADVDNSQSEIFIGTDLIEEYKARLDSISNRDHKSKYYQLPKEDEKKPVFYILDKNTGELSAFGFTPYLKIPYKNSIKKGIKYDLENFIDYPSAMFGFSFMNEDKNFYSYKGRVKFENAILEGQPVFENRTIYKSLLNPKPTSFQLYLKQEDTKPEDLKTYQDEEFELRGRKFYWLKENADIEHLSNKYKANYQTELKPLKKDSTFKGKIRFNSLTKDELGLLIFSLVPFENGFENIGQGKPFGFGKVKISLNDLYVKDNDKAYKNIFSKDVYVLQDQDELNMFKTAYIEYYNKKMGTGYELFSVENISLWGLYLSKTHIVKNNDSEYKYMDLKRFSRREVLKDITQYIKESKMYSILDAYDQILEKSNENRNKKSSDYENSNITVISNEKKDEQNIKKLMRGFKNVKYITKNEMTNHKNSLMYDDIVIFNKLDGSKDGEDIILINSIINGKHMDVVGFFYNSDISKRLDSSKINAKFINFSSSDVNFKSNLIALITYRNDILKEEV